MCQICKEVIQPSLKLKRIVNLIKLILVFYVAIMIFVLFILGGDYTLIIFYETIFIVLGIRTKHFGHILASIIYIIFIFILLLYLFYLDIRESSITEIYNDKILLFFYGFFCSFEVFVIYALFQFYKQAKHEYRIQYGFVAEDNLEENNNDNNNNNNDNNNNNNDNDDDNEQLLQIQPL